MKSLFLACLLAGLLFPAAASAQNCDVLLEWEVVFSLAHDEIVDYQTDTSMDLDMRIKACEIYQARIEDFLDDYPAICDTQDNIKDLTEMKENVTYIRERLMEQSGMSGGRY